MKSIKTYREETRTACKDRVKLIQTKIEKIAT